MGSILKIRDEYFGNTADSGANFPALQLASERTSAREIIRQRVLVEVERLNARFLDQGKGPRLTRSFILDIQPVSPEARLNRQLRPLSNQLQLLEVGVEIERALAAFAQQRFVMLFDGGQVEELDQELVVTPESEMVFLHLTPLRGG